MKPHQQFAPDTFFTQTHCDRCKQPLRGSRTMSWFMNETICLDCAKKEQPIKKALRERGIANALEGCGCIPQV